MTSFTLIASVVLIVLQYTFSVQIAESLIVRVGVIALFIFANLAAYVLWRCLVRPRFSVLRDLPQPSTGGGFVTGHVGAVFSTPLGRHITEWMNRIPNDGLLFFRGVLGAEYLVVTGAEGLRDVLFTRPYDFEKTSGFRRYTRRFLAGGLVVQEGDAHKMRRKAVRPVFQPRNVDLLKPLLCAKSRVLVQTLQRVCEQGGRNDNDTAVGHGALDSAVVDICDWATRFALDIACTVGFGESFGLVESRDVHPILKAYTTIFTGSKAKMSQYAWHNTAPAWLCKILPHALDKEMDKARDVIRELTTSAVMKRIEMLKSKEKAPQDFLSEVILSEKFDPQECADELIILTAAAHESTAALIAMTMYRLCQYPDLQQHVRQELSAFGLCAGHDSPIPESQYEKMTMLNALLNEVMRLEPPLPITLRKTVRDTIIDNHVVKAGTYIVVSPYAMGRSQAIWGPRASEFDPYRWIIPFKSSEEEAVTSTGIPATAESDEKMTQGIRSPYGELDEHGGSLGNHQYGMLTFLKGPKGCTGERFAKAEMRRVIAALVAEFEWTCAQTQEPEQTGIVVVKPCGGILLRLKRIADP